MTQVCRQYRCFRATESKTRLSAGESALTELSSKYDIGRCIVYSLLPDRKHQVPTGYVINVLLACSLWLAGIATPANKNRRRL